MCSRAPTRIASIKQTLQEPLRNKSLEKTSGRVSHTPAQGSGATVGYQKMGYPKQRSKNCLDPKNRTNGINKRGLGRNLRFARDPVAEPQRKQTVLRLARDRLAEAPASRPPRRDPLARGLGRSADSPIRARPARDQPRDRLFDRTALIERRIQAPNHSDRRKMAQYSEVTSYTPVTSTSCHLRWHRVGVTDHCAA